MMKRSSLGLEFDCPEDATLDSYPGALAQVLTNLLSNAATHAFPDGRSGRIRVEIRPVPRGMLEIVFCDDGRGISPEDQRRVFDPFFTTRRSAGSTGLGLHIVFNIVTATLGGSIELKSWPGEGTRFTILVPLVAPDARAALLNAA